MADTEYLLQGFLTKSPPEHKMNRARWQRRWFVLRATDDRVILEYFKDPTRNKLKGTIPLVDCQRVDQGLVFESKRRLQHAHVFDVVTPKRKYYLVAKTEEEMKRWVENICGACGFRSEDEHSVSDSESFTAGRGSYLSDDGHRGGDRLHSISGSVRSEPATESLQESTQDSYIALTACETHSLPRDLEADFLSNRISNGSTSSGSSTSSLSRPPDPLSRSVPANHMYVKSTPTNGQQVYDVPPTKPPLLLDSVYENHRRTSVSKEHSKANITEPVGITKDPTSHEFEKLMSQAETVKDGRHEAKVGEDQADARTLPVAQSNYDYVPPPRPMPALPITESLYDVPPPKPGLLKPKVPERTYTSTNQDNGLYDVPSSFHNHDSIYDIPPVPMPQEPPPPLTDPPPAIPIPTPLPADPFDNSPLPQSNSTDELAKSLEKISMRNAQRNSVEVQPSEGIYDVPPTAKHDPHNNPFTGLALDSARPPLSAQNAPPRPPKPASLGGPPIEKVGPPLQFEDEEFEDTYFGSPGLDDSLDRSTLLNGHSTVPPRPAPEGHHWLESQVHAPNRYLNVRDSPSSKASALTSHAIHSPTGYLPMQPGAGSGSASSVSSNVFTYPDQNYMMMEGSPPPEGTHELYMHMDTQPPIPLPHSPRDPPSTQQPPPLPRIGSSVTSITSEDLAVNMPPPVDRSSKPGRPKTSSTSSPGMLPPDPHGLTNSFYATEADDVGIPVRNSRTKSFTRDKRRRSSPRCTPPMARSHTVQYTSVCTTPPTLPHQAASADYPEGHLSEEPEDAYMRHESFPMSSDSPGSPSSPKSKNKIEYLEIAHDEKSATSPPPAKPSKETSVEYITIDSEKTKALEAIQLNREKSYKGS